MPASIDPMLAVSGDLPREPQNYNFEWKWDGVRALAFCDGKSIKLRSRNQIDITARYPELQSLALALKGRPALLDGEIVALDDSGKPSFATLQQRMHVSDAATVQKLMRRVPILYVLFDVLHVGRRSLLTAPYTDRRKALEELTIAGPHWQMTGAHIGEGAAMLTVARETGLEGIVAKRLDGLYEPGRRSTAWLKIKVIQRQEFVVGGWIPEDGSRTGRIGSMLLGYHDADGSLRYAGRVGTGLKQADHDLLSQLFARHARKGSPFAQPVPSAQVKFLSPATIVEIEFRRWPTGGLVQQGAFKGVRFDKNPRLVVKERITGADNTD
jgi:bifunctional non-homologous end joining protein LigD